MLTFWRPCVGYWLEDPFWNQTMQLQKSDSGNKITGNVPGKLSKNTQVSSVEMLWKLCGWRTRRKCDHVRFVGSRHTWGVTTGICVQLVDGRLEGWQPEFSWVFGILYNQEGFDLVEMRFHRRFLSRSLCVLLSHEERSLNQEYVSFYF